MIQFPDPPPGSDPSESVARVVAPTASGGQMMVGDSAIDSSAVTEEQILADGVHNGPPPAIPSSRLPSPPPRPTESATAADASQPSDRETSSQTAAASGSPPPTTPPAFQSESSQRLKRRAGLAFAGIATLVVLLMVIIKLLTGPSDDTLRSQNDTLRSQTDTPPSRPASSGGFGTDVADAASDDVVTAKLPAEDSGVEVSPQNDPETQADSANDTKSATEDDSPTEADTPPGESVSSDNSDGDAMEGPLAGPIAALAQPLDLRSLAEPRGKDPPPESDPNAIDDRPTGAISLANAPPDAPAAGDDQPSTMAAIPESLQAFVPMALLEAAPAATNLAAPETVEDIDLRDIDLREAADRDDPLIPLVISKIDRRRDLSIELAIKSPPLTVPQWTLLICQLTGVPLEIDLVAFDLVGKDLSETHAIDGSVRSADAWLDAIAASVEGTFENREIMLSLRPGGEQIDAAMERMHDLADLPAAEQTLREFFLIEEADKNWLPADASEDTRAMAAIACECLRRMRSVPGHLSQPAMRRWTSGTDRPIRSWPPHPFASVPPPNLAPVSVADYIGLLCRAAGRSPMVHWSDTLRVGQSPSTFLLPDRQRLEEAVVPETLRPLGLVPRSMDDHYIWFGNTATYDRLPIFLWTEPLGETRSQAMQRFESLRQSLPPTTGRVAYDRQSDRALLMFPRFVARQL